jgi:MinD-like ATPase involved in chromosome partitioning or flagellar assembly
MDTESRSDCGEITSQTVIVLPMVVLILFIAIQSALYFHISHVAGAAAAEGAAAASAKSLTTSQALQRGRDRANALILETGTDLSGETMVLVSIAEVRVTVSTKVPRVVPFFPSYVSRTVVEPRERFIAENLR